jgi:hypothetical protein
MNEHQYTLTAHTLKQAYQNIISCIMIQNDMTWNAVHRYYHNKHDEPCFMECQIFLKNTLLASAMPYNIWASHSATDTDFSLLEYDAVWIISTPAPYCFHLHICLLGLPWKQRKQAPQTHQCLYTNLHGVISQ